MARESNTMIGSGTLPFVYGILPSGERGNSTGEGHRRGTNTVLINPEDIVAVDAFAVSGIEVPDYPIEILAPGSNPLPRMRKVVIQHGSGIGSVFIGHGSGINSLLEEGFQLRATDPNVAADSIEIPIMHNVSVYAMTDISSVRIRMLIY